MLLEVLTFNEPVIYISASICFKKDKKITKKYLIRKSQ